MKVYKIQHKKTKLFSAGGTQPKWRKTTGKYWKTIGQVKASITLAAQTAASNALRSGSDINAGNWLSILADISNWEIIEYEASPNRVHEVIPSDLLTAETVKHLKQRGFEMD